MIPCFCALVTGERGLEEIMPEDIYTHYQHFCEMLDVTPAPREKYEQVNKTVTPISLANYSVPHLRERAEKIEL